VTVYGLNFNVTPIPFAYEKLFRRKIKIRWLKGVNNYFLQGVATTHGDMLRMLQQANNGRRLLHVEERRTANGTIYGIYTY
jgi:hypothetical protein